METAEYVLVTRFEVEKRSIFPLRSILGDKKVTKQSKRNTGPSHSKDFELSRYSPNIHRKPIAPPCNHRELK